MSSEAVTWAFKVNLKPSALKFTLVAMCECANYQTGKIYPSVRHLCDITGQDRKTVMANIDRLETLGLLIDTGERTGQTKQVKVFQVGLERVPETEPLEGSQKRDTIPKTDPLKSTVFPMKGSQKRYTEPSIEPSSLEDKPSKDRRSRISRPESVEQSVWDDFCKHRSRKRADITETAMRSIAKQAGVAGWSLNDALIEIVSRGWVGFKSDWVSEAKHDGSKINRGNPRQAKGNSDGWTSVLREVANRPPDGPADGGFDGGGLSGTPRLGLVSVR